MHPYLIRLGVPLAVQHFFSPYWQTDAAGNLLFDYRDSFEHYGMAYHKVPTSHAFWTADVKLWSRQLVITGSAMEAIAFGALHPHSFRMDDSLFLATGNRINAQHFRWIRQRAQGKSITLVFENSLLGHIADLKMAAGINHIPVAVFAEPLNQLRIRFRMQDYHFNAEHFTLNGFEKVSGFRFGLRTAKSKSAISFLNQLKAGPFIPHL